ncbi:hypothetical protein ElyMa_005730200 [Elysia marginata]|uniref:Uncharacterized protein n=1 Tax=Elysia marginata TaxID=1093978 RepID=A0AAV4FM66_9GAST|nr:hypothetical protein ElyMa_005730200 [Elysia marginata]
MRRTGPGVHKKNGEDPGRISILSAAVKQEKLRDQGEVVDATTRSWSPSTVKRGQLTVEDSQSMSGVCGSQAFPTAAAASDWRWAAVVLSP